MLQGSSVVLAQLFVAQGQYPEAVKHIDLAMERSEKADVVKQIAANLYYQYGLALMKVNQLADAKVNILKSLQINPANMNYLGTLVELEVSQKNIAEAQKILDQFSSSANAAAEHDYLQAIIRNSEGKPEEALALYKQSWIKSPMDITAEAIFHYYQDHNQSDASDQFLDDWVVKLPKNARATLLKAFSAQRKNDFEMAAIWYEKTIVLMPNSIMALNNLAWIYHEQKNPRAIELGERVYKLDMDNAAVIDTYATILLDNNQVEEGYSLLQKAALLEPSNKDIQKHLIDAKKKSKK